MSFPHILKQWARESAPNLYLRYVKHYRTNLPRKANHVLSDPCKPATLSEAEFDELQRHDRQWWPQYDFDAYSTGRRAYECALAFLQDDLTVAGMRIVLQKCNALSTQEKQINAQSELVAQLRKHIEDIKDPGQCSPWDAFTFFLNTIRK